MKIFVSIVSYRDPLLKMTVENVLQQASSRHEITVGIFEQTVVEDSLETVAPELVSNEQVRYKRIDPIYSEGVGWARAINSMQIEDEDFLYEIDSHMLFDKDWDRHLVNDWRKARSKAGTDKVIITGSCFSFDLDKQGNPILHTNYYPMTCKVGYFHYQENNILGAHGDVIDRTEDVEPAIHICAGNFFTHTDWVRNVGINHKVFFDGEEQLMVLSSIANGYKLYHPRELHSYHYIGTGDYVTKQWHKPLITMEKYGEFVQKSIKQLSDYLEQIDEDILEEYREYSGVDYINQRLEPKCVVKSMNPPPDVLEPLDVQKRKKAKEQVVSESQTDK
jgi:hypothetical protein